MIKTNVCSVIVQNVNNVLVVLKTAQKIYVVMENTIPVRLMNAKNVIIYAKLVNKNLIFVHLAE